MNKKLLVAMTVAALLLAGVVAITVSGKKSGSKAPSNPGSVTHIDKDTGETVVTDTTKSLEKQSSGLVSIYAGDKVYNLMSQAQYDLFRESISFFVKSDAGPSIDTVKVLPATLKSTDTSAEFQLKTVKPEKLYLVRLSLHGANSIKILYLSPDGQTVIQDTGYLPEDPTNIPTGD